MEFLPEPRTLLGGLTMVESARWRDGRLWFAHWGAGEVVAVDMDGTAEVMAEGPPQMGWPIDWLPDGRLVTTGPSVTVHRPDGTPETLCERGGNEVVVDHHGHLYVNGADFDFRGGGAPEPGWIRLVAADGSVRQVAGDIDFPNGMVVTPDGQTLVVAESFAGRLTAVDIAEDGTLDNRRVWADGLSPDGICVDAESAIWVQAGDVAAHTGNPADPAGACVRVLEGGTVTHRVETDVPCFACTLGGPDGRHLFLLCNEFEGVDRMDAVLDRKSARILVTEVPAPGAGRAGPAIGSARRRRRPDPPGRRRRPVPSASDVELPERSPGPAVAVTALLQTTGTRVSPATRDVHAWPPCFAGNRLLRHSGG